jgi:hypothetical protein
MVNYPLRECLENTKCEANEVLGLRNVWHNPNEGIGNHSSIVEYLRFINLQLTRMVNKMTADANLHGVHEVLCYVKPDITPAEWLSIMSDAAQRLAWINDGITHAKSFLDASSKSSQNANSTEEKERNSSETK